LLRSLIGGQAGAVPNLLYRLGEFGERGGGSQRAWGFVRARTMHRRRHNHRFYRCSDLHT